MFESAELHHSISKSQYAQELPLLREKLLELQFELQQRKHLCVLIVIAGVDGAGKGETINLLNAWMDPRTIETSAFTPAQGQEKAMPPFWRYWQALPERGRIGIFFDSWYSDAIEDRARGRLDDAAYDARIQSIINFENMLRQESVLILKYWFHLSKSEQKERLEKLAASSRSSWRVTEQDWYRHRHYREYRSAAEHVLRLTSTGDNPWLIIDGSQENYRNLSVGQHLRDNLSRALEQAHPQRRVQAPALLAAVDQRNLLNSLKLNQRLSKSHYKVALEEWQGHLNQLLREPAFQKEHALAVVFEGNDAAGKGGSIRRITQALDARHFRVVPIAAPTPEEAGHPYLWRFWRHLPYRGRVTIFDRSWYGRVLVERIEKFCSTADWMRAYDEINQFEHQLAESRILVVKFWLAISKEEQARRFEERERTGFKRFKITAEDWRNRERWEDYVVAVNDMVDRTSTQTAPWILIEANNKYFARIKILRSLCEHIEAALDRHLRQKKAGKA